MSVTVTKVEVWSGEVNDAVGALAGKLEPVARARVNLQFVFARRQPDKPGSGVVFLAGPANAKAVKAYGAAGLTRTTQMAALRVEAPDKAGALQAMICTLAEAGINLRGVSASVVGKRFVTFLAFDSNEAAAKAANLLKAARGQNR